MCNISDVKFIKFIAKIVILESVHILLFYM